MRKNQSSNRFGSDQGGFGGIEALLIIVVIFLLGLAGWYIYHVNHRTTTTNTTNNSKTSGSAPTQPQTASRTYTDNAKVYSVSYPEDWTVSQQSFGDNIPATPLDTKVVKFTPNDAPDISTVKSSGVAQQNSVSIFAFKSSDTKSLLDSWITGDKQSTPQNMSINDYSATYQQSSSTTAPTYTDDVYAITHNNETLVFTFREKQGTDGTGTPAFNATNTVPAFMALVKSVKFLN
jgi:cytoskeletal protein RodZ